MDTPVVIIDLADSDDEEVSVQVRIIVNFAIRGILSLFVVDFRKQQKHQKS